MFEDFLSKISYWMKFFFLLKKLDFFSLFFFLMILFKIFVAPKSFEYFKYIVKKKYSCSVVYQLFVIPSKSNSLRQSHTHTHTNHHHHHTYHHCGLIYMFCIDGHNWYIHINNQSNHKNQVFFFFWLVVDIWFQI